jgi:CheY-like chemotaxis protein
MTSEQIARIFEPFYTSKEAGKGTGLGLPIISSILHNNSAHLTLSSTLNVGSTFYLHFPAIFASQQTAKASVNTMITQQTAFKICIVDDDVLICDLLREKFIALGYDVKVFHDSLVANTYFIEHLNNYDAVVIDIAMPKLSGLELANTLLTKCPDIPIIFLTGYSKDNICDMHLPRGNTFLFRKPFATATEIHSQLVEFFSHKNAINKQN